MKRVTWKELTCPNCNVMEVFPLNSKEYICGSCGCDFSNPREKKNIQKYQKKMLLISILPISMFLAIFMPLIKAISITTALVIASILVFEHEISNKKLNILKNIVAFSLLGGGYLGLIVNIALFMITFDKKHHASLVFCPDYFGFISDKNITISISNIAILSGISLGSGVALNGADFGKGKKANLFKKIIYLSLICLGLIALIATFTILFLEGTPPQRAIFLLAIVFSIFIAISFIDQIKFLMR